MSQLALIERWSLAATFISFDFNQDRWCISITGWIAILFDNLTVPGSAVIRVKSVGPAKPNQNAYAERREQSIQQKCLDRFIVFGEDHLQHIISQYIEHYNTERPH